MDATLAELTKLTDFIAMNETVVPTPQQLRANTAAPEVRTSTVTPESAS